MHNEHLSPILIRVILSCLFVSTAFRERKRSGYFVRERNRGGICTDALQMGKVDQQLPLHQQQINGDSYLGILCEGCSMGFSRMCKVFNFKCLVVLILSVSVFLSAIFWVFPNHSRKSGFDAKDLIKHSGMPLSLKLCN